MPASQWCGIIPIKYNFKKAQAQAQKHGLFFKQEELTVSKGQGSHCGDLSPGLNTLVPEGDEGDSIIIDWLSGRDDIWHLQQQNRLSFKK